MTLAPILAADPVVQGHLAAAILAILLGPLAWARRRRDALHRALGYCWIAAMLATALTAGFIHQIRLVGPFSPIHLFIPLVVVHLWGGVRHARAGRIAEHRATMTSLYSQALGIAGLFTLLPGRLLSDALFPGAPVAGFVGVALAIGSALVWQARRRRHRAAMRSGEIAERGLAGAGASR